MACSVLWVADAAMYYMVALLAIVFTGHGMTAALPEGLQQSTAPYNEKQFLSALCCGRRVSVVDVHKAGTPHGTPVRYDHWCLRQSPLLQVAQSKDCSTQAGQRCLAGRDKHAPVLPECVGMACSAEGEVLVNGHPCDDSALLSSCGAFITVNIKAHAAEACPSPVNSFVVCKAPCVRSTRRPFQSS